MNTFQKVIKYTAMAIGILLAVGIVSGIVGLVKMAVSFFGDSKAYEEGNNINIVREFEHVEQLDIKNGVGKLIIKAGDGFKVEGTNVSKNFKANVKNGTLYIEEEGFLKKFLWFNFGSSDINPVITVYLPEDFTAQKIKIDSGAGKVVMEDVSTEKLIIKAGVGEINGYNITANSVIGNGGVGDIDFSGVVFSDVDFDCGVGNLKIEGMILGDSEFDCGVGNIDLYIKGSREDYALRFDSSLGTMRVNGEKVSPNYKDTYKAAHTISIDGSVGNVNIEFSN